MPCICPTVSITPSRVIVEKGDTVIITAQIKNKKDILTTEWFADNEAKIIAGQGSETVWVKIPSKTEVKKIIVSFKVIACSDCPQIFSTVVIVRH